MLIWAMGNLNRNLNKYHDYFTELKVHQDASVVAITYLSDGIIGYPEMGIYLNRRSAMLKDIAAKLLKAMELITEAFEQAVKQCPEIVVHGNRTWYRAAFPHVKVDLDQCAHY